MSLQVKILQAFGYRFDVIQLALNRFAEPSPSIEKLLDIIYEIEDELCFGSSIDDDYLHEETDEELEGAVGGDIRQRSTLHPMPEPEDQASHYQASLPEVNSRLMSHQNSPRGTTQNSSGEGQANHIVRGTPSGDKDTHKAAVKAKVDVTHSNANHVPSSEVPKPVNSESHTERFQDYLERLNSFRRWPKSDTVTPDQLANAGFYYTGKANCVQCVYCNIAVDFWLSADCPLEKHREGCTILRDAQRRKGMTRETDKKKEILKKLGQSDEAIRQAINFLEQHNMGINARNVLEVIFAQEDGKKMEELLDQLKPCEDTNLGNKIQILTEHGFEKEMVKQAVTIAEEGNSTNIHDALNILFGMESERDRHEPRDQEREEHNQTLQRQVDGLQQEMLCKVCRDARICVLFLPCRHLATCETCGKRFHGKRCPLCRQFVRDIHHPVFF